MDLISFCRAQGILIDAMPPIGVWKRYPTDDHPRSRNGAVKYMGTHAFVQNHALDEKVATWKPESIEWVERERFRDMAKHEALKQAKLNHEAAQRAAAILRESQLAKHDYLRLKGFPEESGYVWRGPEGDMLVIPMRVGKQLVGCQLIDKHGSKKFLYGQRSSMAEFIFDNGGEHIYCEGYATALSVRLALKNRKIKYTIHVCFSAHNLLKISKSIGSGVVVADNDKSGTGERIARESGLPYWISDTLGQDGNDYHLTMGLFRLSQGLAPLILKHRK